MTKESLALKHSIQLERIERQIKELKAIDKRLEKKIELFRKLAKSEKREALKP